MKLKYPTPIPGLQRIQQSMDLDWCYRNAASLYAPESNRFTQRLHTAHRRQGWGGGGEAIDVQGEEFRVADEARPPVRGVQVDVRPHVPLLARQPREHHHDAAGVSPSRAPAWPQRTAPVAPPPHLGPPGPSRRF
jgi:hypothetical protein